MKTIEFIIPMPLSVEEYEVAQAWAFVEQSKRETGGGEGVRVVTDEAFKARGQYTYKIYQVGHKVPSLARALLRPIIGDEGCYEFHEEAWNVYPYCKTIITNPGYLKENFRVEIESAHRGGYNCNQEEATADVIDIFKDECAFHVGVNVANFKSAKANRGPLKSNWTKSADPIMTCHKSISVHCKIFGLQSRLEAIILNQYREMLLGFHQQIWAWTDDWFSLSLEDVRALEKQAKSDLDKRIMNTQKCGTIM